MIAAYAAWLLPSALLASFFATGQTQAMGSHLVSLDAHSEALFAPSPNGAYALIGDVPSSQLFLEDTRAQARRLVFRVTVQTMSVIWSPDSTAFVANDRAASSWEDAYLYNAQTLKRLDLRKIILAADKRAARIVSDPNTGHAYVHAISWTDDGHVEVILNGRTDAYGTPERVMPGRCFDLRYRVSLAGAVAAKSKRTRPASECDNMDGSAYGEDFAHQPG
jgi:hypothetical protein